MHSRRKQDLPGRCRGCGRFGSIDRADSRPRLTQIIHSVGRDWKARSLVADACTVGINVYRPVYQLAPRLNPKRAAAIDGHNRDDMLANARMYIDGLLKSAKCRLPCKWDPFSI